jgi:uncharacterized protein (DUF885 family)
LKNLKTRIPALALAFTLIISLYSCRFAPPPASPTATAENADALLDAFAEDYFKYAASMSTLDMHFTVAYPEEFGIERPAPSLGRVYGDDLVEEYDAVYADFLDRLDEIPREDLSREYKYAYDNWELVLESSRAMNDDTMFDELYAPLNSLGIQLLLILNEYRFYTSADIDDYIGILLDAPRFFAEANEYELARADAGYVMGNKAADDIIEQCRLVTENPDELFLIAAFDRKLDAFAAKHPELTTDEVAEYKLRSADAVKTALVPAYQSIADTTEILRDDYDGEFTYAFSPESKDKYEQMVQHNVGTTKTIKAIRAELSDYINALYEPVLSAIGKHPEAAESEFLDGITYPYSDPEDILEYLRTVYEQDFPTIGNFTYELELLPEELMPFTNPAMYFLPPIDAAGQNLIYIGDTEKSSAIFTVVAHEGVPGHLYQYQSGKRGWQNLSIISTSGYDEGWATYVQGYSYKYAQLEPWVADYLMNYELLNTLLSAMIDVYINYDGWTVEELNEQFQLDNIETAQEMYDICTAMPGAYLSYAYGACKFLSYRDIAREALGSGYSDLAFHTAIVETGAYWFPVLDKALPKAFEKNSASTISLAG